MGEVCYKMASVQMEDKILWEEVQMTVESLNTPLQSILRVRHRKSRTTDALCEQCI